MRTARLAAATCVAVLALAGCSATTDGTPQGNGSVAPTTNSTGSSRSTATSSGPTSSLSVVDPCELLSSSDATTLGFGAGKPGTLPGGAKRCSFTVAAQYNVGVSVRPTTGLSKLNTQSLEVAPIPVGNRQAQQMKDTKGSGVCSIEIAVTDSSSAGVSSTPIGGSTDTACAKALEVAKIIEPKLP